MDQFHILEHLDQVPWICKFACAYVFICVPLGIIGPILFGANGNNFLEKLFDVVKNLVIAAFFIGLGVTYWG